MSHNCEVCHSPISGHIPTCNSCRIPQIKKEIRETKKFMKENRIRVTSCFNGGLTRMESYWNRKLFDLKSTLLAYKAGQI